MKRPYLKYWERIYLKRYRDGIYKTRPLFITGYELSLACRKFRREILKSLTKKMKIKLFIIYIIVTIIVFIINLYINFPQHF